MDAAARLRQALELDFEPRVIFTQMLGMNVQEFADAHGFTRSDVSMCFTFHQGRVYERIREAVAAALGVDRALVDEIIDSQKGPEE